MPDPRLFVKRSGTAADTPVPASTHQRDQSHLKRRCSCYTPSAYRNQIAPTAENGKRERDDQRLAKDFVFRYSNSRISKQ
jgi:hypothetical protein